MALVLCLWRAEPTDRYVDSSYTGATEAGTLDQPCKSISKCVYDFAQTGDTILLQPGNYNGGDNVGICSELVARSNNCSATGLTISGVHSDPTEVVWSWDASSSYVNSRALVSDGNRFVRLANMTITGFTVLANVTGRDLSSSNSVHVGGLSSVLNTRYEGGALEIRNTSMEMYNIHFVNNSAGQGGAMSLLRSNVSITDCIFANNFALIGGGGISARSTTLMINHTDFVTNYVTGNIATQSFGEGGAIVYVGENNDQLTVVGGVFKNNSAPESGGAIHVQALDHVVVTGTTFYNNKAQGDGVCLVTSSACEVRGGAIFSTVPGMVVSGATFTQNSATTLISSQNAEGGAIYTTSAYAKIPVLKMSKYIDCFFEGNSASTYGGAIYILNQYILIQGGMFRENFAGSPSLLFADATSNGGAIWFSAQGTGSETSQVDGAQFEDNLIWGGGGGAVYVTTTPNYIVFHNCTFKENTAVSTYTFPAKGGALMMSRNSVCRIYGCRFYNNTAVPRTDLGDRPRTLSGLGGAVFVQSANISITSTYFEQNMAFSGQFDGGPAGGALNMEDAADSIVKGCTFINNGAVGFVGSSSYGSSGTGGALYLSFCVAGITECTFQYNWVSAGGAYSSSGGAASVFFDYTSSTAPYATGITFTDCLFDTNYAFSGTCDSISGDNAGQGGAMAVVGTQSPGTVLNNVTFYSNMAVSRTGIQVLSYGGALLASLASTVTGEDVQFHRNVAFFGLGNDVGVMQGQGESSNSVQLKNSAFTATPVKVVLELEVAMLKKAAEICSIAKYSLAHPRIHSHSARAGVGAGRGLRMAVRDIKRGRARAVRQRTYGGVALGPRSRQLGGPAPPTLTLTRSRGTRRQRKQGRGASKPSPLGTSSSPSSSMSPLSTVDDFSISGLYHYPAMIITDGDISVTNSSFGGKYHIFVGDYRDLIVSPGQPVPATPGCTATINGVQTTDSLSLTAFRSSVTAVNTANESLVLEKLLLMNSSFSVSNDMQVRGNSSVIDSVISRANITGSRHDEEGGAPNPVITFYGNVYTGFDVLDLEALSALTKTSILQIRTFPAVVRFDGCTIVVLKTIEFSTPRLSTIQAPPSFSYGGSGAFLSRDEDGGDDDSAATDLLRVYLSSGAYVNITANASMTIYSPTYLEADSETEPTLVNHGEITLDGSKLDLFEKFNGLPSGPVVFDDDLQYQRLTKDTNSLKSTLTVYGAFTQAESGCVIVTLNRTGQTSPVLNLVSNESFLGHIGFRFSDEPSLSFYEDGNAVSSWAIATYEKVKRLSDGSDRQVQLYAPEGLGFGTKLDKEDHYVNPANETVKAFVSTYVLDSISCEDAIPYSNLASKPNNGMYPCFVCLSNSSCNLCGSGACADSSTGCAADGGVAYRSTCCAEDCNANGDCVASNENTMFTCKCNPFYAGSSCKSLSNISIVIITLSGALVIVIAVVIYNYRLSVGKKSQVLEELRQGLLFSNEDGRDLDTINDAYIQSLQQGLILKDASVKFKEIKLERQVGEGSFGVVYKALFRGASVAVKRMRPVFAELTNKDIEEFNKEAYMMSRLRHPNIVLVMGISYVDPATLTLPRKKSSTIQSDLEEEEEGERKKESLPNCVCIVTEFLEQGSLADILYGPRRLPAEIWTYDLILTCALQAARGMLYLHSHSPPICHRDLKSSNLVVDDHWVVKVTDFGMSRIVPESVIDIEKGLDKHLDPAQVGLKGKGKGGGAQKERESGREREQPGSDGSIQSDDSLMSASTYESSRGKYSSSRHSGVDISSVTESYRSSKLSTSSAGAASSGTNRERENLEMTSNLGTTAWCAPEVLTASNKASYSVKVDVYSFGMVLWELWERKRPFEDLSSRFDIMDAVRSGRRPTINSDCPPAYRSLIQRCWQGDPSRRPMFQYIVRYLKDELARVKRRRERSSSTGATGTASSQFAPKDDYSTGSGSTTSAGAAMVSGGAMALDAVRGQINRLMPWSRSENDNDTNDDDNDILEPENGAYVSMGDDGGVGATPITINTGAGSGSGAGGHTSTQPMTIGRDSLDASGGAADAAHISNPLLRDPDINLLAASPAVTASGAFFDDRYHSLQERQRRQKEEQEQVQLRAMQAYQARVEKAMTASVSHAQTKNASGNASPTPISGRESLDAGVGAGAGAAGGPPSSSATKILRSSRQSRDKYVMKFSGWQPSQPDAGLPPSSGTSGTPRGDSFLTAAFSGERSSTGNMPVVKRESETVDIEKIPPRKPRPAPEAAPGSSPSSESPSHDDYQDDDQSPDEQV